MFLACNRFLSNLKAQLVIYRGVILIGGEREKEKGEKNQKGTEKKSAECLKIKNKARSKSVPGQRSRKATADGLKVQVSRDQIFN